MKGKCFSCKKQFKHSDIDPTRFKLLCHGCSREKHCKGEVNASMRDWITKWYEKRGLKQ